MFSLRKWLFDDPTADWKQVAADPILGELRLSEDADWWEATANVDDHSIRFCIGGEGEPNANLLSHAHDIVREFSTFERNLVEHLSSESKKLKEWVEEIKQLRIESVNLFWPHRPNDGEIVLSGPDPYRIWHCGYVNRNFVGLGFDD